MAATDATDVYTEFSGSARLRDGISPSGIFVDQPGLSRSATAPSSRSARTGEPSRYFIYDETDGHIEGDADTVPKPAANLARAQTTINVPSNFRDRIAGRAELSSPNTPTISRSNTMSKPNTNTPAPSNATMATDRIARNNTFSAGDRSKGLGSLSRGPSTKRAAPSALQIPPIPENAPRSGGLKQPEKRISEFYENYLDEYGGSESATPGRPTSTPTPPARPALNKSRSQRESTMSRISLRSAPVGGSMKRRSTAKRSTRGSSRAYEEEEEGYGSGDYEDLPLDMQKIRVKVG